MKKLGIFGLAENVLENLPEDIRLLSSLRVLDVRKNPPLGEAARLYHKDSLQQLFGWLAEFVSGTDRQDLVKIMIVAEGTNPPFPPPPHT